MYRFEDHAGHLGLLAKQHWQITIDHNHKHGFAVVAKNKDVSISGKHEYSLEMAVDNLILAIMDERSEPAKPARAETAA